MLFYGLIGFVAIFNMAAILISLSWSGTTDDRLYSKHLGGFDWPNQEGVFWNGVNILSRGTLIGNAVGLGLAFLRINYRFIPLDAESYTELCCRCDWNWPVLILNPIFGIIILICSDTLDFRVMVIAKVDPININQNI